MTDANPYTAPASSGSEPVVRTPPSTRRLWAAYAIAPLFAPLAAAITLVITGIIYQLTHPEDVDVNPMSLVVAPLFLLVLGVPASYGMAGVIGMPIVFWLRNRGRLNGYTIHGAALVWAAAIGMVFASLALLKPQPPPQDEIAPQVLEILGGALTASLACAPFFLLSATAFWLIGVRQRQDSPTPGG